MSNKDYTLNETKQILNLIEESEQTINNQTPSEFDKEFDELQEHLDNIPNEKKEQLNNYIEDVNIDAESEMFKDKMFKLDNKEQKEISKKLEQTYKDFPFLSEIQLKNDKEQGSWFITSHKINNVYKIITFILDRKGIVHPLFNDLYEYFEIKKNTLQDEKN